MMILMDFMILEVLSTIFNMNIFFIGFFVFLGFIIGSFLNVVTLRLNTGKSLGGRSSCYSCSKPLLFHELIPVVSWVIQGGRCRNCSSRISKQYLYGELLTGSFFGLAAMRGLLHDIQLFSTEYVLGTFFLCLVFSILVIIFLYDMKHKIIPDFLSLIFTLLGIVSMFFFGFQDSVFVYTGFMKIPWSYFLAMILVPSPFFIMWIFSKGRLIGLGDPKLMVGIAGFLGISLGFSAVFVSFWIGTLFLLLFLGYSYVRRQNFLLNNSKKSIMKTEIPFGPFLILGFIFTIITHLSIFL